MRRVSGLPLLSRGLIAISGRRSRGVRLSALPSCRAAPQSLAEIQAAPQGWPAAAARLIIPDESPLLIYTRQLGRPADIIRHYTAESLPSLQRAPLSPVSND